MDIMKQEAVYKCRFCGREEVGRIDYGSISEPYNWVEADWDHACHNCVALIRAITSEKYATRKTSN